MKKRLFFRICIMVVLYQSLSFGIMLPFSFLSGNLDNFYPIDFTPGLVIRITDSMATWNAERDTIPFLKSSITCSTDSLTVDLATYFENHISGLKTTYYLNDEMKVDSAVLQVKDFGVWYTERKIWYYPSAVVRKNNNAPFGELLGGYIGNWQDASEMCILSNSFDNEGTMISGTIDSLRSENNSLKIHKMYEWNADENGWDLYKADSIFFNNGTVDQVLSTGGYYGRKKFTYEYDDHGNCTEMTQYLYDTAAADWEPVEYKRCDVDYNKDGYIRHFVFLESTTDNHPVESYRMQDAVTIVRDGDNRIIQCIDTFTYNDGAPTVNIDFFTYDTLSSSVARPGVWPNPENPRSAGLSEARLSVYMLSGKLVKVIPLQNNELSEKHIRNEMPHVGTGVYYGIVSDSQGRVKRSMRMNSCNF